jgi:multimeric flavodoxin WrbA
MEAADAIVVGTPTYWGNMTAPLKALFDRNVTLFETFEKGFPSPRLKGKVAAIVVSTGASWPFSLLPTMGGGAVKSLKTILQAGGLRIVGRVIVAGAGKRGATNEQLRIWGFRIADRLRKLSSNPQLT